MSDLGSKMGARLLAKVADHEAQTRCGRIDMAFVDYDMLDPHTAMIMLEYQPSLGAPRRSQVEDWVQSTFQGRFRPASTTLRHHVRDGVVTLVISEVAETMPADRTAGMVRMAAARYMDDQYRTWEISKNEQGERHLKRLQQDNIEQILQERVQRRRQGRYASVTLATLRDAGMANPSVGDSVIYYDPSVSIQQAGEITALTEDYMSVGGKKVPRGFLVEITERSSASISKQDAAAKKFWKEAYGPDFPVDKLSIKKPKKVDYMGGK
jgi:hypothetical protein